MVNTRSGNTVSPPASKKPSVGVQATQDAVYIPGLLLIAIALLPLAGLLLYTAVENPTTRNQLISTILVSIFGYVGTVRMIPFTAEKLLPKLHGVDINKRGLGGANDGEKVPESLGLVSGMMFLVCLVLLQLFHATSSDTSRMLDYHAAMLSVCFAILLGFADDVIDIKWRNKLLIGVIASLPLIASYSGPTSIVIPKPLQHYLASGPIGESALGELTQLGSFLNHFITVDTAAGGAIVELGVFYKLYMGALVVFCTNAVNIYAGINGLEAGQSFVIGCSVVVMNLVELATRGDDPTRGNHLFSVMLMLPFIATTLGLLQFNWYPSRVFVGDIFPYYAGISFAVAGILGHFSKSLLLLLIPQILNFLYSSPQLFHLVPIPRHRLPRINKKTGILEPSKVGPNDDRDNMTLICLALRMFGPMHERSLCLVLLIFQLICAVIGLFIRYTLVF